MIILIFEDAPVLFDQTLVLKFYKYNLNNSLETREQIPSHDRRYLTKQGNIQYTNYVQ